MTTAATANLHQDLYNQLLDEVESIVLDAHAQTRPPEVDPFRGQLFALFAQAYNAGLTADGCEPDLSADGLCKELATRWGLRDAATQAMSQQTGMSAENLAHMRLLWSVMRMWMEWTYAWDRSAEFRGLLTQPS